MRLNLDESDSFVSWLPLYHDMGVVLYLLLPAHLHAPFALVSTSSFAADPSILAGLVEKRKGTISGSPTYGLSLLERGLQRADQGFDLSTLGRIVCGAEMIDLAVCERFLATGANHGLRDDALAFGYGLAEATLGVSLRHPSRPADAEDPYPLTTGSSWNAPSRRGFARTGPPLQGVDIRIRADDGSLVSNDGIIGSVEVGGASVMSGYVRPHGPVGSERHESEMTPDSWLRTGDLGYLRAGELVLTGRRKDVIVVGGRNLTPSDIEGVVGDITGIHRGRVVAVQVNGRAGEGVAILAEAEEGGRAHEQEVRQALRSELELSPEVVLLLPRGAIPVTTSGKLQRGRCREIALSETTARIPGR